MKNKQIIYIPANDNLDLALCYFTDDDWIYSKPLEQKEVYVFTSEELKQLLESYTNRIVEKAELTSEYIDEVYDSNFEDTALSDELIFLKTDGDGMPYAANKVTINKESITNQLNKILKELEL